MSERPRVGVSVIVLNESGDVLLGVRKGSHGQGTLAFPGGHMEYGESFYQTASRELEEETGLVPESIEQDVSVTNDIFIEEGLHYITVFVTVHVLNDCEPKLLEPEKCEQWKWFRWQSLREKDLFLPVANLLRSGYVPCSSTEPKA